MLRQLLFPFAIASNVLLLAFTNNNCNFRDNALAFILLYVIMTAFGTKNPMGLGVVLLLYLIYSVMSYMEYSKSSQECKNSVGGYVMLYNYAYALFIVGVVLYAFFVTNKKV